jgi:hypothetical protein
LLISIEMAKEVLKMSCSETKFREEEEKIQDKED